MIRSAAERSAKCPRPLILSHWLPSSTRRLKFESIFANAHSFLSTCRSVAEPEYASRGIMTSRNAAKLRRSAFDGDGAPKTGVAGMTFAKKKAPATFRSRRRRLGLRAVKLNEKLNWLGGQRAINPVVFCTGNCHCIVCLRYTKYHRGRSWRHCRPRSCWVLACYKPPGCSTKRRERRQSLDSHQLRLKRKGH